ncbi:hypothetical protein [Arthrobacter sp. MP_2.3]|uniref:hypothetical protein n=1 Tax=Arthrobacter sp. MP_2.3 TaxID=3349633 RepID=UPI0038D4F644
MSGRQDQQPTDDEKRFMANMGMTEVEPGRWLSGWEGSDPDIQEWLDSQGDEGQEQLDLAMRAGRVQNEFDLEQTGAQSAVSVQKIPSDLEEHTSLMAVFVAVKKDSVDDFEALEGDEIQRKVEEVMEQYDEMLPPDLTAVALRKLGIKCKTILTNPENTGPDGPDPLDYPGFRAAVMHFPGAKRIWIDPE